MAAFTIPHGKRRSMGQITLTNPHWEALTPETRQAFEKAANLPFINQFYLAGGTGLALHLGHRFSMDLDFFSPAPEAVGPEVRAPLRETLDDLTLSITHDKDGTFAATWRGVGISFFRLYMYPLVQQPLLVEGVPVATVEEIGAMKLAAIERLFEVAAVKYARVHTFTTSATRALAYFDDAEALPMPLMIDHTPWTTMKRFLERQAMEVGRKRLGDLWP